jgi:hypothetical protein
MVTNQCDHFFCLEIKDLFYYSILLPQVLLFNINIDSRIFSKETSG